MKGKPRNLAYGQENEQKWYSIKSFTAKDQAQHLPEDGWQVRSSHVPSRMRIAAPCCVTNAALSFVVVSEV